MENIETEQSMKHDYAQNLYKVDVYPQDNPDIKSHAIYKSCETNMWTQFQLLKLKSSIESKIEMCRNLQFVTGPWNIYTMNTSLRTRRR